MTYLGVGGVWPGCLGLARPRSSSQAFSACGLPAGILAGAGDQLPSVANRDPNGAFCTVAQATVQALKAFDSRRTLCRQGSAAGHPVELAGEPSGMGGTAYLLTVDDSNGDVVQQVAFDDISGEPAADRNGRTLRVQVVTVLPHLP